MPFDPDVSVDMLKVGEFDLVEARRSGHITSYEKILITSSPEHRVDEYYISEDRLVRFIGINSNVDIGYIENLIRDQEKINPSDLYEFV